MTTENISTTTNDIFIDVGELIQWIDNEMSGMDALDVVYRHISILDSIRLIAFLGPYTDLDAIVMEYLDFKNKWSIDIEDTPAIITFQHLIESTTRLYSLYVDKLMEGTSPNWEKIPPSIYYKYYKMMDVTSMMLVFIDYPAYVNIEELIKYDPLAR